MGSIARQNRQLLGLASALVVCVLLSSAVSGSTEQLMQVSKPEPEFRIVRLAYDDGGFGFRGQSWTTDMPEAEYHLTQGIRRLSRIGTIDPEREEVVKAIHPGNKELFKYPFAYAVEVGRWYLSDDDAANLREYLLRGGFLMVDDFHGDAQWEGFMESFRKIFPELEVVEIPDDHEVFHVLYDLDHKVQIPGIYALQSGVTCEQCYEGGAQPHWRGVFDKNGRLMVAINFNMDLGDAWEHADSPGYPQPLTALAYRFAISYALYAMSH